MPRDDIVPEPFGSNTAVVERFLARIAHAPARHWLDAALTWTATPEDTGLIALRALSDAVHERGLAAGALVSRVRALSMSLDWQAHRVSRLSSGEMVADAEAVAINAALALALRGAGLAEEHVRVLYGPWQAHVPAFSLEAEG